MPTSLREIRGMLHNRDVCHKIDAEYGHIVAKLPTKKYDDTNHKRAILIAITVEENGEFIKIIAPNVYKNSQPQYDMAVFQTCMHTTRNYQLMQCCFDESTGEICILVEIFLGESPLSERQLINSLLRIVDVVNTYDDAFRSAINTGQFTFRKIYADRIKLATLAKELFDVSSENLDQILKQLECVDDECASVAHVN